ncbi:MAG: sugar nucleotide-binding protein [Gemmatimonadaceae bacterium]|jgi:dTDP-4-dehydrorhamnose reductase
MRFLVLGANGMAGHTICLYLKRRGHSVVGIARTASPLVEVIIGDVRDSEALRHHVQGGSFDAVINCIGILNKAAEHDKAAAVYINALLPHLLADITRGSSTQVIHLSTDCVFSGKRGQYREDDFRDGETFYDRSKALGELEDDRNVTLRTSIVGPDLSPRGIGLLNWFMQQPGPINGFTGSIWNGQTTLQLARTIEYAAAHRLSGLYNTVPDCAVNKFELLRLFNWHLRHDTLQVNAVPGLSINKSLVRTRLEVDFQVPDIPTMVAELAEWIREHRSLYPHYDL